MARVIVNINSSEPLLFGSEEANLASQIAAKILNVLESDGVGNFTVNYDNRASEIVVEANRKLLRSDTTVTP